MPLKYGWKNESSRIAYAKDQRKVQNSEYNKNSEKGEMTGAKGWVTLELFLREKQDSFQRWLWVINIQRAESIPVWQESFI